MQQRQYLVIDQKSFYATVECVARGLDPMEANLVVADPERSKNTICLAVSPHMKAFTGRRISSRQRKSSSLPRNTTCTEHCILPTLWALKPMALTRITATIPVSSPGISGKFWPGTKILSPAFSCRSLPIWGRRFPSPATAM